MTGEAPEADLYDLSEAGRARQRAAQASARGSETRGLVIVNTGNGKGKTTAALGVLLRAWGREMNVVMYQFLKATTANFGEIRAAKKLGIELRPLGKGFTWMSKDIEDDAEAARAGWQLASQTIASGEPDIVILDEFTYVLSFGWVDVAEVLAVLAARRPAMHVIITGRKAAPELIEAADLVTEMTEVKHPYRSGVKAQRGIEF